MLQTNENHTQEKGFCESLNRGFKVYIGNLDPAWSETEVYRFMSSFGHIAKVIIPKNEMHQSRGFGFAVFESAEEASKSFGTFQYQHKVVVVRPSHYNGRHDHDRSEMKYPDSKYNQSLKHLEYSEEGRCQYSISPRASTNKSSNLCKKSKIFGAEGTRASLISKDLEDVRVKVVNFSEDMSLRSTYGQIASEFTSVNSSKASWKNSQKAINISKYSKEFHPRLPQVSSTQMSDYGTRMVNVNPAAFISNFSQHMTSQLVQMKSQHHVEHTDQTLTKFSLIDSEKPISNDSTVRIGFYTFPGRE